MPRYIDVDKAIKRLKASPAFPNMGTDGYFLLGVVEDLLKMQPTADVAPKSEVAREIFAEIEIDLRNAIRTVKECGLNEAIKKAKLECYEEDMLEYIAELKKKYTEGKE